MDAHYSSQMYTPVNPLEEPTKPSLADQPWAGVPDWAVWSFFACGLLIVLVLTLDYCVIRRNALGNTCCTRPKAKRPAQQQQQANVAQAAHLKRSTNMLLNV